MSDRRTAAETTRRIASALYAAGMALAEGYRNDARGAREAAEEAQHRHSSRIGYHRGQNPYDHECDAATEHEAEAEEFDALADAAEDFALAADELTHPDYYPPEPAPLSDAQVDAVCAAWWQGGAVAADALLAQLRAGDVA